MQGTYDPFQLSQLHANARDDHHVHGGHRDDHENLQRSFSQIEVKPSADEEVSIIKKMQQASCLRTYL